MQRQSTNPVIDGQPAEAVAPTPLPASSAGLFAGAGALVGLTALVSSSCCIIPLALAGLGATGAVFSALDVLAAIRPYLLGGAALALLAGFWLVIARQRSAACTSGGVCAEPRTSRRTLGVLALGSVFLALAIVWEPLIEPVLLKWMR